MPQIRIAVICAASFALLCLLMFAFAPETGAAGSAAPATSRDGIWQTIDRSSIAARDLHLPAGSSYRALRLNKGALAQQLARAPMEGSGDLRNSPVVLSLPMPDGSLQRFHVEESPIMEPSLAARLPGVKTYRGRGIDDATASTRFDLTPQGFHALVLSAQGSTYVEPGFKGDTTRYVTHPGQLLPGEVFKCGVTEADEAEAVARGVNSRPPTLAGVTPKVTNGSTLRTYRLAIATTGEWFGFYGGGSVANAQAAITSIINLVDAIYERDVAIRFTLVNNTNIIFTNSGTDPYPSPNQADDAALNANQATLDDVTRLGSANYDVGHVFGGITVQPNSSSFSGKASVGVTCSAGNKARGVSTMGNNPASPTASLFIAGIAHEIGHEFSATHTFNATTGPICSDQRTGASAYEVGGGSTLMSYQTCGAENLQPQADQYFHVRSLEQIVNYATNSAPCATTGATGNDVPIVTGPGNFTIPANTPFQLTATASDANGSLTYSWEEYDLGNAGPPNTDDGSRPIFRGYSPATIPTRIFPSLQYILNNANVPPPTYNGNCRDGNNTIPCLTGESLPSTSRTMNFQLVVRDNQANGGAISTAMSVLTVTNAAGPFAVTFPNGGETIGSPQLIKWNVAGTNAAPVNTANVKISLSTDGGNTFPTVLTASAPNTGMVGLNLPEGIIASNARIKVEAVGNIFFDISDGNFTLVPGDNCPAVSSIMPNLGNVGTVVTITGVNLTGVNAVKFAGAVATSFTVNSDTQITATVPGGAMDGPLVLSKPNCEDLQAGTFSVCSNPPAALSIDDGSRESVNQNGSGAYYVNRLTPASYPATLTKVSIFWDPFQDFPPGTAINVVAGANLGGTTNIDGTSFQSFAATSGTSGFITYTLPNPLTITAGDFVVGYRVPTQPANSFPVATDTNNPASRSYVSNDGTTFTTITDRNYMIRAAQVYTGCSSGAPMPVQAVSRKPPGAISASRLIHAPNVVSFDVPLPLMGNPGIECRSGGATGDHQVVVTFPTNVTVNGSPQARVTIGTGQIGSGGQPNEGVVTVSGAVVTIPLTNVPNGHKVGVTLFRVSDGTNSGSVTVPMGVLLGDTTGNGTVNATDVSETKSKSGQSVNASNFRDDVTVSGNINSTDVSIVKSKSGTALP
jgi:hypothetical protein